MFVSDVLARARVQAARHFGSLLAVIILSMLGLVLAASPAFADSTSVATPPPATQPPPTQPQATQPPAATTPPPNAAPAAPALGITPQPTETAAPPAATTAAAPAAAAEDSVPDADGGWPRAIPTPTGGMIVMYQPQVESWEKQQHMKAMAAVSYTPKGSSRPALGTVRLESPTSTSVEDRMVNFQKIEITSMRFSSLEKNQAKEVLEEIKKALPKNDMLVSLDRILTAVDTSAIRPQEVKINTEPPPIFYSKKPAILVQFDSEPMLIPISGTPLSYAVNTNWDVFQDADTKLWYLRNDTYWLQTKDFKKWEPVKKLPPSFDALKDDDNWKEVKAHIPAGKMKGPMPVIFTSNKPSELILVDGSPDMDKVEGTDLLWVNNTDSDLFMYKKTKEYFVLLSGRWFKTKKLDKGPWAFATTELPPDFAKIPRGHDRAHVLASVPGTDEASTAILLAQVPRTARVDAKALKAPDVKYDGQPSFQPVKGTKGVSYAENSAYDVLQAGGQYYLCYQGVWFKSASATGPFAVATSIPEEIYSIPTDSPAHHVTYVTIVDDDEDNPTYAYTAGYMGMSIAFGCVMWGSGYYYPPYWHGGAYYPRPVAYGGGAAYNPWTGAYGGYQAAYGPYGGVARGASYNPSTGTYKRGAMAWGPTGAQGVGSAYNPRTGTYAGTRQGSNVYGSWGSTHVQRGDDWVRSQRVTDAQGNTKWKGQGSGGGSAAGWRTDNGSGFVGKKGDDVYAGRDGNVYRKGDSGWQQWEQGGGWNDVNRPSGGGGANRPSQQPSGGAGSRPSQQPGVSQQPAGGNTGQLDREARARSQGEQRTRDYGSYQRSGGSSGSRGGYSGGSRGGGSRGGGGMRGGGGGGRRR